MRCADTSRWLLPLTAGAKEAQRSKSAGTTPCCYICHAMLFTLIRYVFAGHDALIICAQAQRHSMPPLPSRAGAVTSPPRAVTDFRHADFTPYAARHATLQAQRIKRRLLPHAAAAAMIFYAVAYAAAIAAFAAIPLMPLIRRSWQLP